MYFLYPGILTPTPTNNAASGNGNPSQNWVNSRPNSSSIHTPSPTSGVVPQLVPPQQQQQQVPAQVQNSGSGMRLPPPLAPITTQQPPSSILPPAYTPPTHTGFQTSPHSSS